MEPGVQRHDQQRREHHVELVRGEAVVPVGCPAGQLAVRQDVVAEERRTPHVGAHVAARRRRVQQEVAEAELAEDEAGDGEHDGHVDDAA